MATAWVMSVTDVLIQMAMVFVTRMITVLTSPMPARMMLTATASVIERPYLNPASRCAFCRDPETLFVDGESFPVPLPFAERFCETRAISQEDIECYPALAETDGFVDQLVAQGTLIYPPEDF